MLIAIIGLAAGVAIGMIFPAPAIPPILARYTAIAILGVVDSLLGALNADLQRRFNNYIFATGLLFNMIFAVAITYLGDTLSLDLYLAVIVVFTIRIFGNISAIRYHLIAKKIGHTRVKKEIKEKTL